LLGEIIDALRGRAAERTAVVRTEFTHAKIIYEEVDDVWFPAACRWRLSARLALPTLDRTQSDKDNQASKTTPS
jgi:hypothetical protein